MKLELFNEFDEIRKNNHQIITLYHRHFLKNVDTDIHVAPVDDLPHLLVYFVYRCIQKDKQEALLSVVLTPFWPIGLCFYSKKKKISI